MLNKLQLILSFVAFVINVNLLRAQTSAVPNSVRAVNTLERLTDSNGLGHNEMLYGIPLAPGTVVGDNYLSTNFSTSAILLYKDDDLITGYPMRYDIVANQLDIKFSGQIKVLEGNAVKSFLMIDSTQSDRSYFINAREYKLDGTPLTGFFEVLADGKAPLFKKVRVVIKKADYNEALAIGTRDDKILKQPEYYIGASSVVTELSSSKRKFLLMFGTRGEDIGKFIDDNALSIKRESDLVQIFKYYNTILAGGTP